MRRQEQGFTLIESMCAVVVTALTLVLAGQLWQTSLQVERQAELHFAIANRAVSTLEELQVQESVASTDVEQVFKWRGVSVTQRLLIEPEAEGKRITLRYAWQERGKIHEQVWALLHA